MSEKVLKLTIPKGSLQEDIASFFERAGLKLKSVSKRDYRPSVGDPEIYIKLLRPQEIPNYLIGENEFDLGISGIDWVKETKAEVDVLLDLEIGAVSIVLCAPNNWENINSTDDILQKFYDDNTEYEWNRLGRRRMEFEVSMLVLEEYLPEPPVKILDIGGGPDRYSICLAEKGYDNRYGARPLKRMISKYVENALSMSIMKKEVKDGDKITIDLKGEVVTVKRGKK